MRALVRHSCEALEPHLTNAGPSIWSDMGNLKQHVLARCGARSNCHAISFRFLSTQCLRSMSISTYDVPLDIKLYWLVVQRPFSIAEAIFCALCSDGPRSIEGGPPCLCF
jgi:hypothetical protein